MSWLDRMLGRQGAATPSTTPQKAQYQPPGSVEQRMIDWECALQFDKVPNFVVSRLKDAASGKTPWLSTMTPAELRLAQSHGIQPLAMVSGTCWLRYGYSWTKGHAEGWHKALARLRSEALAVGANAVVDVKMRRIELDLEDSMDFTLVGTAVRINGLPPSTDPVIATVPALEFVRLLDVGIVPVGIAIGAHYEWLTDQYIGFLPSLDRRGSFVNQPLTKLGGFWERVRRTALAELRSDTQKQGNGVLAHTHFGQLFKVEQDNDNPPMYLGRHIVVGTVIDRRPNIGISLGLQMVVDMRDDESPLQGSKPHGHNTYTVEDEEGAI